MDLTWPLVVAALLFGGFVKGVVGLGLPLVATPIVANLVEPRTAVVVLAVPIGATNGWVVARSGTARAEFRRIAGVFVGVLLGTFGGANLLVLLDVRKLSLYVGAAVIVFVALQGARLRLTIRPRSEPFVGPLIGLVAGIFGASTTLYGPLLALYLLGIGLTKRSFVVAISILFMIGNVGQVIAFWQLGLYAGATLLYSIGFTVPALLGLWLGLRLQDRVNQRFFNGAVLVVMLASALSLVWKGL